MTLHINYKYKITHAIGFEISKMGAKMAKLFPTANHK